MADFLFEIGSEEIPARMQSAAAEQLRTRFIDALKSAGLAHGEVVADATPRRLWLIARDVAVASAAASEERRGPKADAPPQAVEGFLRSTGLTRDQLEERDDAKGRFLYAVIKNEGRSASAILSAVLPEIVRAFQWPKSMRWGAASATTASPRWVRPLTGFVALLDADLVPFEAHGLASGRTTTGHRIHAPGALSIDSAATYAGQLRTAKAIVSSAERRALIAKRADVAAAAAGLTIIPDDGLVAENAGLTEWPVPLLGHFDPAFLAVPREVIQLTMRTNQKYFACADSTGALAPAFVCVANLEASDGGGAVTKGNERVLSARLSDAKFFWDQDVAAVRSGGLDVFMPKLETIVFHEKLGTMADKVDRVAKLARWLVESGAVKGDADLAERAARLAKADLVSATVGEFPEVQGIAGAYLARMSGEDPAVADAIRDHYKPVGQGDDVPTAPVSVAVALADKLDTLVGFFAVEERPTGSRDPFALRRSALGLIEIIIASGMRVGFREILRETYRILISQLARKYYIIFEDLLDVKYSALLGDDAVYRPIGQRLLLLRDGPPTSRAFRGDNGEDTWLPSDVRELGLVVCSVEGFIDTLNATNEFLFDRLRERQRRTGRRHDLITAILPVEGFDAFEGLGIGTLRIRVPNVKSNDDPIRILNLSETLQSFLATDDGASLLAGYKRAANILRIEEAKTAPLPLAGGAGGVVAKAGSSVDTSPPPARQAASPTPPAGGRGEEDALATALDAALPAAAAAVAAEDFTAAMTALATLRAPVDAFFEAVMVNDPDPVIRARRLALLARFRDAVHTVADFSKIA